MRKLLVFGISLALLICCATWVYAQTGQFGTLVDWDKTIIQVAGQQVKSVFGHLSYYPASAWGTSTRELGGAGVTDTSTQTASFNAAGDLAVATKIGALGVGAYAMDSKSLNESGLHFTYLSKSSLGLLLGTRSYKITDEWGSYDTDAKVTELLIFPRTKGARSPRFTLGIGMIKPEGGGGSLPSWSINTSIPMRNALSWDFSLWATRDKYTDSSGAGYESWSYRYSAGVGLSF